MNGQALGSNGRRSSDFLRNTAQSQGRRPSNASSLAPGESFQLGLEDLGSLPDPGDLPIASLPSTTVQAQLPSAFAGAPTSAAELDDLFGEPNNLLPALSLDRPPSWIPSGVLPHAGVDHIAASDELPMLRSTDLTGMPAAEQRDMATGQQHASAHQQGMYADDNLQNAHAQQRSSHINGHLGPQQQQFWPGQAGCSLHAAGTDQQRAPLQQNVEQQKPAQMSSRMAQQQQQQHFWYHPQGQCAQTQFLPGFMPGMDPAYMQQAFMSQYGMHPAAAIPPHLIPNGSAHVQTPQQLHPPQQQQQLQTGMPWMPVLGGHSAFPQQQLPHQQQPGASHMTIGYPIPQPPQVKQEVHVGSGDTSSVNQNTGDSEAASGAMSDPDSGEDDGKHPRRRLRNEQQKMSNRVAQRRYRLRGKHKAQELETTVAELSEQLAALQPLAEQKHMLKQHGAALQAQLRQSQAHLQHCRGLAAAPPAAPREGVGRIDDIDEDAAGPRPDAGIDAASQQREQQVANMRQLASSLAMNPQPETEQHMRQLNAQYLSLAQASPPSTDEELQQAMHGAVPLIQVKQEQSGHPVHASSDMLKLIAGQLGLTAEQKKALLTARQHHDAQMQPLITKQHSLSQVVETTMQGADGSGIAAGNQSKPADTTHGFYRQAQQLSTMKEACGKLRTVLGQAHELQATFTKQVALEILTPAQTAVLIVSMHPAQLDALGFCDAAV